MSRYSTTSPSTSQTRLYRMRPLSLACTWWNLMSWSWVALYTLTGTLTSPNEIEPFQMERMLSVCPYSGSDTRLSLLRRGSQCVEIGQVSARATDRDRRDSTAGLQYS